MTRRIRVQVEDEPLLLWPWSRVKHALIRYSEEDYRLARLGRRQVVDAAGERVDLEGALQDGARLYLR